MSDDLKLRAFTKAMYFCEAHGQDVVVIAWSGKDGIGAAGFAPDPANADLADRAAALCEVAVHDAIGPDGLNARLREIDALNASLEQAMRLIQTYKAKARLRTEARTETRDVEVD